mgnify:CR=1
MNQQATLIWNGLSIADLTAQSWMITFKRHKNIYIPSDLSSVWQGLDS